jgi:arylsulfatase A-like enzyme
MTSSDGAGGPRLSRRRLLQAAGVAGAGAALPLAAGCAVGDDPPEPENVVVIVIDSLRPDFVGAYGSPRVRTPHLDALFAKGLRFNRAFPEALVTVPARRSIFTGQRIFPYRDFEPVYDLGVSPGWTPIENLDRTLMKSLSDAGYRTIQVTDNPHTGFTETYKPFRLAWDEFVSIEGRVGTRNPVESVSDAEVRRWLPKALQENERYVEGMKKNLANTGYGRDEQQSDAARVFGEASQQLEDAVRRGGKFALVVDCFDPHEPWSPPREYIDLYGDPDYDGPEIGTMDYGPSGYLSKPELRRAHADYAAAVTMTDRWLGSFLDRFEQLGLADNTAIVLLADHGVLLGERGWVGKIPGELHPEMAQVPFAIVHPAGKRAGESSDYFASTHDVAPTVLSLLGIDQPHWMNGHDLSPLLDTPSGGTGDEQPPARPFHYGGMYNRYFIRTDRWVLLGDNLGGNRQLFDLTLDPGEFENVAETSRQNKRIARELYHQVIEATGGEPLPYYDDEKLATQLEAARVRKGYADPTP